MNFISISKKFPGDAEAAGQVPYSETNYSGNKKFSKTSNIKVVLSMSNNQTSYAGDLTQSFQVNKESLVKVTRMYVDKVDTLYMN